ncbi:MAG TPA: ATP-binding protein [Vicinamibacterales bacterium]|jgi:two-component system nitrogen regulation sensor histidine kinase NtrY|nr:ATP-binding protein [Vicinamibacterales bacterium]
MNGSPVPVASQAPPPAAASSRRPFRDNPRLIIAGLCLLVATLVGLVLFAGRSTELYPDFLSEVVLNALVFVDFTMVCVFVFYLARNIIKLVVERRRALPFARFRAKLVAALLAMTIVPSVLVLIIGSELIRRTAERWFSAPIEDVLKSANQIAGDYYQERERLVLGHSERIARAINGDRLAGGDVEAVRAVITPEITQQRLGLVEVYRIVRKPGSRPAAVPVVAVESSSMPRGHLRAFADRLAERVAGGGELRAQHDPLEGGGELVRAPAVVRTASGAAAGVVIASDYLSGSLATHSRRIVEAYEDYSQLRVLRRPLEGVYLSFFLLMTLMVLASATWMGVYIAKRITRPVQMLAEGARAIGSGRLDHRIEQETADEFGSLVEAFNTMAGELAVSQRRLDRSRTDLERQNITLEQSRHYIETILQRIATGVVSIGPDGTVTTVNAAAGRQLGFDGAVGRPCAEVFGREELKPLGAIVARALGGAAAPVAQEVALVHEGRELHFAAAATALTGETGDVAGAVLVFDDVTPLIRAQRVAAWRDVARRLAHEIKNPLTPIQLSAERLRRHFGGAPPNARALVEECTDTIVAEVESLKALVDEFAQFARMPTPRAVPSNLNAVLHETLLLYDGLFRAVRIERAFADELPPVRVDPEQIKRVVINLVDNAVEAMGGRDGGAGVIVVSTVSDEPHGVARIVVADNGPGIPPADRDKLFMPYYSTKRRGSGLGLAIVRRIVIEHGGSIEVADNPPKGTKFTIELPL